MNRITVRFCLAALAFAMVMAAFVAPAFGGATRSDFRVTIETPDGPDSGVRIDGTRAVWVRATTTQKGTEVYTSSLVASQTGVNITAARPDFDQLEPDVSGSRIVYSENLGTGAKVLRWRNLTTGTDSTLCASYWQQGKAAIEGDTVLFLVTGMGADNGVYRIDFVNGTPSAPSAVVTGAAGLGGLSFDGTTAVWYEIYTNDDFRIRAWDLDEGEYIFKSEDAGIAGRNTFTDISGGILTYQHQDNAAAQSDIHFYDLTRGMGFPITASVGTWETAPCIDGDRLHWVGPYDAVFGSIWGFDFASSVYEIVSGKSVPAAGTIIDADESYVAWSDGRSARADVWASKVTVTPERIADANRFSTAVAIARSQYTSGGHWTAPYVVLASGDDAAAADPLAASGLCWAYDAPMLLTSKNGIPGATLGALAQILSDQPTAKVIVVGGSGTVPEAQLTQLKTLFGSGDVERLKATGTRYDQAAAVSARMRLVKGDEMRDAVFFANGADSNTFFDALSLSAISRAQGIPILLVSKTAVPSATTNELAALSTQATGHGVSLLRFIGGGPATVSELVRTQLGVNPTARWYGANRYETSAVIAERAVQNYFSMPGYYAVAATLPDALTGGATIGRRQGLLLVTASGSLPTPIGSLLHARRSAMGNCYIYGGTGSVTTAVESQMKAKLAP